MKLEHMDNVPKREYIRVGKEGAEKVLMKMSNCKI